MKSFFRSERMKTAGKMILGGAFAALGMTQFLVPARLSAGGVGSLGTVLLYLFSVPLSLTTVALNGALIFFGGRVLGKKTALLTVFGILVYSLFLELFALAPPFSGDPLIASVCGGCLSGLGVGLTLRADGSTGGSDLAGLMLKKKFAHIPTARLILFLDVAVIVFAGLVFRSLTVAFFSSSAMFFSALVSGGVLEMGEKAKTLLIISEKSEAVANILLHGLRRGVTKIPCRGGWGDREGALLLSAVRPKDAPLVIQRIKKEDPKSFIILLEAREVLGEGFKPFK